MFGYSLANQSSTLVKFQISKRQGLQKIKILGWGDDSIMLRGFVTLHKYEERPEFKCTKVTQGGKHPSAAGKQIQQHHWNLLATNLILDSARPYFTAMRCRVINRAHKGKQQLKNIQGCSLTSIHKHTHTCTYTHTNK